MVLNLQVVNQRQKVGEDSMVRINLLNTGNCHDNFHKDQSLAASLSVYRDIFQDLFLIFYTSSYSFLILRKIVGQILFKIYEYLIYCRICTLHFCIVSLLMCHKAMQHCNDIIIVEYIYYELCYKLSYSNNFKRDISERLVIYFFCFY